MADIRIKDLTNEVTTIAGSEFTVIDNGGTKKITWTNIITNYISTFFVSKNTAITGATKTKITYDSNGLVTAGADATTADISDSLNKRYVSDAQATVIGNTSGTNTGDNATNTQYSGLATSKEDLTNKATDFSVINNTKYPTTQAVINAINGAITGLWDDRGTFSAVGGAYPTTGGSGTAGAILKGDTWTISAGGTLPTGQIVEIGDVIRALIDTPAQLQANWAIQQNNIGYVAENQANKSVDIVTDGASDTKYPSAKAVKTYSDGKVADTIINGIITVAPSQNAVFDALATKEPTLTKGNLTESTSSLLTITGGTGAVIGSGASIKVNLTNGNILVGNASNVATSVTMTGDATISNAGAVSLASTPATNSWVIGKLLTGLSTVTSTVITATDSILVALGKLQAQTFTTLRDWVGGTYTYSINNLSISAGKLYISLQNLNINNPPSTSLTFWDEIINWSNLAFLETKRTFKAKSINLTDFVSSSINAVASDVNGNLTIYPIVDADSIGSLTTSITTSDATQTSLDFLNNLDMMDGDTILVYGDITVNRDNGDFFTFRICKKANKLSGTITLTNGLYPNDNDLGGVTYSIEYPLNNNKIEIAVKGLSGHNLVWKVELKAIKN